MLVGARKEYALFVVLCVIFVYSYSMKQEFITIGEASKLLQQTDGQIMRLIKDLIQQGANQEEIMKKEMREGRMMMLVCRELLERGVYKEEVKQEKVESPIAEATIFVKEDPDARVIKAKDEMIAMLQKVLETKDGQMTDLSRKIDQLIERDHETNILLKGLQDKLLMLEQGGKEK